MYVQAFPIAGRLKAVAADLLRLLNSPSTRWNSDELPPAMMSFSPRRVTVLICFSCLVHSSVASGLLPERWIENIAATDGSVQQSLVFRTTRGVGYRVESSGDLVNWVHEEEIYGMGHEFVVPMRQFTPPPPLPPGSPPVALPPRPEAAPTLMMAALKWRRGGHGDTPEIAR